MPESTSKTRRRWLQFRLQTLLVIVAVLCVPLAWVAWKMDQKRHERAVIAELERLGSSVGYDWQMDCFRRLWVVPEPDAKPTGPHWLRRLLGDDFFSHLVYIHLRPDLETFFGKYKGDGPSSDQYTRGPVAKDGDLRLVATFSKLEVLDLSYSEIGDAGLTHLKGLAHLRFLNVSETNITDAGLRHLKSLTTLKYGSSD